ncbi:MAG: hypothetical protein ACRDN8_04320 [Thermoleophilaceae bacterium]
MALLMYGEGEQIRIAKALADLGSSHCGGVRSLVATGRTMPHHDRQQQIALLDAFTLLAFDQPLRAAEPSGRAAHLSSECEVHTQPERTAHSARSFAAVQVPMVGTLETAQVVVVAAEHVGRRRQQLKIARSQRRRLIGD